MNNQTPDFSLLKKRRFASLLNQIKPLTKREYDILRHTILFGIPLKDISVVVKCSIKTLESQMQKIKIKLYGPKSKLKKPPLHLIAVDLISSGFFRSNDKKYGYKLLTTELANRPETSLNSLAIDIHDWANTTFPNRTHANTFSKLVFHEIPELFQSGGSDPLEYADILILLLDLAKMKGIDIEAAIKEKMRINRERMWKLDTTTGIHSHVEKVLDNE
jgi:DNA-binding CsgD family transcriptional regulator